MFQAFLNDWKIKVQSLNNRISQSKIEEIKKEQKEGEKSKNSSSLEKPVKNLLKKGLADTENDVAADDDKN